MADNRSIAYQEGDLSIYRASGSGSCLTALVAAKLGYEEARTKYVADILNNAAREGNLHEDSVVNTLKEEHGWRAWGSQDIMEHQVIPRVFVRGHIDGFCKPPKAQKDRLLEVKTMSKDRFKKWMSLGANARTRLLSDEFESYAYQISWYMIHYNMSAMYVVKNRDSGLLDISEIKTPPIDLKTLKKKIIAAEMWFKRGELPPCETEGGSKFFCPFPYLHTDESPFRDEPDVEAPPFESAQMAIIEEMAKHYVDLQKKVGLLKPYDEERKEVGKKLIEAMGGVDGPQKMVAGEYSVSRVDNTRSYVDNQAVADALGLDVDAYKTLLDKHKTTKKYPYPKITKLGDK